MKTLKIKDLKPKNKGDKLLKHFIETSRSYETVITYSKAEDGLPKKIVEKESWD